MILKISTEIINDCTCSLYHFAVIKTSYFDMQNLWQFLLFLLHKDKGN